MRETSFVDCFSGAGGLSLGLQEAGMISLLAFDSEPIASATLAQNLGGRVLSARIEELDSQRIREDLGAPDVVVGGPPCQGFSTQRRGKRLDSRNDLVTHFFRFALALRPRVIVMENVPGVLGTRGTQHIRQVFDLLHDHGLEVDHQVVEATSVEVPQRRRRAIVVAWNPDLAKPFDFNALSTTKLDRTVRDAIGDMPPPPDDFTEHPDLRNHTRVRISELNLQRIRHVPPGGGRLDIPEHLQMDCHRGRDHRHLDVFGRLTWDEPAATITAMFDNFTRGRFAHPQEHRNITNREGARLQSFPDWYAFSGAKKQVARQIGNAVPPLLGRAIGTQLMRQLGR